MSRLERQLHERVAAAAPRDLIALERCAREHADWEGRARALASDIEAVQDTFRGFIFYLFFIYFVKPKVLFLCNNRYVF